MTGKERYWTVYYTRPRSERKAASELLKEGFEVYVPYQTQVRQWSDRKKKVEVVLFTSYLFARVNEVERTRILESPRIVANVKWLGKPAVVQNHEIDRLKRWLKEYESDAITVKSFNAREQVRLTTGPLMDETAEVIRQEGKLLKLVLTSIGMEVSVDPRKTGLERL